MTHIHLLNSDFREDKRPTKLVDNALEVLADTCKWKYVGAQADKKAKHTEYSLKDMFNSRMQTKINNSNKNPPPPNPFEYVEGFSADVQTFVKTNYDLSEYDVDFKQLAKLKKEKAKAEMEAAALQTRGSAGLRPPSSKSQEEQRGLYRTGVMSDTGTAKGKNTMQSIEQLYDRFDPKKLQVRPGIFDFTKAHDYNEDLVRYNLNKVVRPVTALIKAPTLVKEIIIKEKPDFVRQNKTGLGEVSSINLKRVQMMKQ